jgi:hypothetical protein
MADTVPDLRGLVDLLRGDPPRMPVNWTQVVSLARRHGMAPLLHWRLGQESSQLSIPSDINDTLQHEYYTATVQSMLRDREVKQVVAALSEAGVPVLVLKGTALARTVYPNPALRPMCDADIVVREAQFEQASGVLEQLGYTYRPEPPQRFNPFNTAFTGERSYRRAIGQFSMLMELHCVFLTIELVRRTSGLTLETLWARAVPLEIGEVTAFSLSPEDQLMHVCLHMSMHGFVHLRGYVDIMRMVDAGQIDWQVFADQVKQSRFRVACYFPLWWAERVWRVPVPEWVLRSCRPGPLRVWMGRWMVVRAVKQRLNVGHAWDHVAQLLVIDRLRDLLRALWWLFFPGPAWLRERYHLHSNRQAWAWMAVHPAVVLREGLNSLGVLLIRTGRNGG